MVSVVIFLKAEVIYRIDMHGVADIKMEVHF